MDTIRGNVTKIIDGDTFDMNVTHTGKENEYDYNDDERIRIAGIDAPELNTSSGQRSKKDLENKLSNAEVRVYIKSRDNYSRIVGDVKIL